MKLPPLPKNWLIHSIDYIGVKRNRWDEDEQAITINYVRVEDGKLYNKSSTTESAKAQMVIFVDALYSTPLTPLFDFKGGDKIRFNGAEYEITKVLTYYQLTNDKVHHWEIEVT